MLYEADYHQGGEGLARAARRLGSSIECTLWVLNQANTPSPQGLLFFVRRPLSHVPEIYVSNSLSCEGYVFRS